MKLLNKSGLYNFLLSLLIIAIGGFCLYIIVLRFVDRDATENLYIQRERVERELPTIDSVPHNSKVLNSAIEFTKINANDRARETVKDTLIYEDYDDEYVPYRILSFSAHSRLYNYRVAVRQSLIESNDLLRKMGKAAIVLLILYLIALVIINRLISKELWRPFYRTLDELKAFDLQKEDPIGLKPAAIDEFKSLNVAINLMTEKIRTDYRNLKEFTENASHEIQTPLSIIRSKIELMLQAESMSKEDWKNLDIINDAAGRLSKLNQSLLLLSKIDNGQFASGQLVNMSDALMRHMDNLKELIQAKELMPHVDVKPNVFVSIHPYLLDILLSNILMNAIRHNIAQGFISVHLQENVLSVQNSGGILTIDPKSLFSRFKKGDDSNESIGIGLSLVKKIADASGMDLQYTYQEQIHTILLKFK